MKKQKSNSPKRIVDERDPVWTSIEDLTAGLNPQERFRLLDDMVKRLTREPPKKFDLDNLPFDPAVELMREAQKHLAQVAMTEAHKAMQQGNTPEKTEPPAAGKQDRPE